VDQDLVVYPNVLPDEAELPRDSDDAGMYTNIPKRKVTIGKNQVQGVGQQRRLFELYRLIEGDSGLLDNVNEDSSGGINLNVMSEPGPQSVSRLRCVKVFQKRDIHGTENWEKLENEIRIHRSLAEHPNV